MSILDEAVMVDDPPRRDWSEYQGNIFEAVHKQFDNLIVQAVAGSGKTTTLVEATTFVSGSALFLAFNKGIAEELRSRTSIDCKTMNALGHQVWRQEMPHAKLDAKKLDSIIARFPDESFRKEFGYTIKRAVGLAKNCAFGIGREAELQDFAELIDSYLDVDSTRLQDVALASLSVFEQSLSELETFDFDDQLYVPLAQGWAYPTYWTVFVDECQDLSPIQHLMLANMQTLGSRIIAVGDRNQAIYGFRGAAHDSMDLLKSRFSMVELPLSISYRCAQRIVEEAQMYSEHIQARPNAPLGAVRYTRDDEADPEIFVNQLILCRNNAPMFRAIMRHIRQRKPCRVLSNFLEGFQGFIRKFKGEDTRAIRQQLDKWYLKEKESAENKGFRGKVAALADKYETVALFCEEYRTKQEILDTVYKLSQCATGPLFSTIHKAKGLEHQSVHILRPDLMPAFYATSKEQLQQESNLTYVAITRAIDNLTWGERR